MRVHNMRAQLKECDLKVDAPEAKGGAAKSNVLRIFQNGSASKVQAVIHTPQKWCSASRLYTLKTQSLHVTYCRHGSTVAAAAGKMELGSGAMGCGRRAMGKMAMGKVMMKW